MWNAEEEKKKAKEYAKRQKLKQEIKRIKHQYDEKRKPLSFGKWGFIFLIANCTIVEIYSMVMMAVFADLSTLSSLIVAVVGECICLISYNVKSQMENRAGGLTYEMAMKDDSEDTSVG